MALTQMLTACGHHRVCHSVKIHCSTHRKETAKMIKGGGSTACCELFIMHDIWRRAKGDRWSPSASCTEARTCWWVSK